MPGSGVGDGMTGSVVPRDTDVGEDRPCLRCSRPSSLFSNGMVTAPNGNAARAAVVSTARSPSSYPRYTDAIAAPTVAGASSRSSPLTRCAGPVMSGAALPPVKERCRQS